MHIGDTMRILIPVVAALFFFSPSVGHSHDNDCKEAVEKGGEAYKYAKKAYREKSRDEAKSYIGEAEEAAEEARSAAKKCDCDKAEKEFDEAYSNAKSGVKADSRSELREYAKKVMHEAEEGKKAAERCK
jgi:hypothetical protein